MSVPKIVLAYSGGLDTSCILRWLLDKGHEVVAYVGDVGQREDLVAARDKALAIGASRVVVEDLREELVTRFVFPAIRANAVYEGRYLLGTSLARPLIARRQIELAAEEGTDWVAHGATGKGNDQVRFELTYYAWNPNARVIAPWKDPEFLATFKGRGDLMAYADRHGIPIKASRAKPYSEDENLMHKSYESGILEDPMRRPDEAMFELSVSPQAAPDRETVVDIEFKDGTPVRVTNLGDGTVKDTPLGLFEYLNDLAGRNGIGRIDIVENRFVGIKSRGVYETPAGTVLMAAHRDLEGIAMDREVQHLRDMLVPKFAELIYNGFWYSPEMDFLMNAFDQSQQAIDGRVRVALYKGNVTVVGRESPTSLYNQDLSSMEVEGGFDQTDSAGFIRINALRLKAHTLLMRRKIYERSFTDGNRA
jgi:argininosuccinate synthase